MKADVSFGEDAAGVDAAPCDPRREWRGDGTVVAAAVVGMMVASLHSYSIGVMIVPLEREFGWSRGAISTGMLICSIVSVICSPFFGIFIDRFGPRRIGLVGVALYSLALALLSMAGPSIASWWGLWFLLSLALLNTKPTVWIAAVSSLFDRSRGLAIALVLSATGLSQAFTPLLTYALVEAFGWRGAYVALGAGAAIFAMPVLWFWLSSAKDRARQAARRQVALAGAGASVSDSPLLQAYVPGVDRRAGLLSRAFAQLAVAALAMSLAGGALTVNLVPMLNAGGLSGAVAVSLAGLSGLSAIAGRIVGGLLLDRFNARAVGGVAVLLPIVTCAILLLAPGSVPLAVLGVLLSGLASGAEMDAIAYLASRSFGMRNFGLLFGSLSGVLALGVGLGPMLANLIYDHAGSYHVVLVAIVPLCVVSSAMFLLVPRYPDFAKA